MGGVLERLEPQGPHTLVQCGRPGVHVHEQKEKCVLHIWNKKNAATVLTEISAEDIKTM